MRRTRNIYWMRRTTTTRLDTVRKKLAKNKTGTGMTVSRMRANFGEVTISRPIEPLGDRDLILPDFKQNADFKFCVHDTEIHILLVGGLGCVINRLIPGKLYIKKKLSRLFSRSKHANFRFKCFLGAFFSSQTVYYTRNEDKAKRNQNFDVIYILNLTVSRGTSVTSTS